MLKKLTNNQRIEKETLEKNEMLELKAGNWFACFSKAFTVAAECAEVGGFGDLEKMMRERFYEEQRQDSGGIF